MAKLLYEDLVKENKELFIAKVREVCERLGIEPNWLMAVMKSESNLSHTIQNTKYPVGGGYATGLIQFIPSTAAALGTTTDALKRMRNYEQLEYVYRYFKPFKGKIHSYPDLYMATFWPLGIGKPDTYTLQTSKISASAIARSNPIFDLNKDGYITAGEVRAAFLKRVPESLQSMLYTDQKKSAMQYS